ncbi:MAG: hypothetical protein KBT75_12090 [Oleispira antarctica]|uniref:Protein kinase n=1 Tax=Oleispira antarctica RB-8 TaxID=698738 RepID=R4YMG6_OLEAN|nr:hypothetical protein [Oleispira antarctica]MBQ0793153.1 hypothetical protein [Oleispira antarctica]CCK74278.1 protein kinase [Oleispira antarctica RB-8]|tara:strand:- start:7656 stop:8357 length:702 start_codon:yes stop_codon:yes gene_type:complete
MIKLSTFHLSNKRTQLFLTTRSKLKLNENLVDDILVDHTPSLVGIFNESKFIIKFIRARSWHEYLKLLWNHSRITKEVKGSSLLAKLGLKVPTIHEVGYGIVPSANHEFLGYYVMENLIQSGFQELSKLIKEDTLNEALRGAIMKSIYDGLKAMRDNHIVFSDFHLDNVFANNRGEIVWIDAGVTTYRSFNTKKFTKKHNHSINRYIDYSYSGQQLLLPSEKTMFSALLLSIK